MRGVGHRAQLSLCTTTSVTLLSLTELTTQGSTVLCLTTPVLPGPALRVFSHTSHTQSTVLLVVVRWPTALCLTALRSIVLCRITTLCLTALWCTMPSLHHTASC